jgi:hypothetical protein
MPRLVWLVEEDVRGVGVAGADMVTAFDLLVSQGLPFDHSGMDPVAAPGIGSFGEFIQGVGECPGQPLGGKAPPDR